MYPYFLDRMISRRERKGGVMRALILTLSILAIIDSAHIAKAGMSSTPREWSVPADPAIAASEAPAKRSFFIVLPQVAVTDTFAFGRSVNLRNDHSLGS